MSLATYQSLTLEELVRQFRETAGLLGTAIKLPPNFDKFKRTPERRARVEKIRALAAELAARNAIPSIRAMFEDEDVDIRGSAAGLFISFDPTWASASFNGILYDLTTREVLALTERARTPPPKRPTLREMTVDALVQRFEDSATREFAVRFVPAEPTDMTLHNRIAGEVADICRELKRRDALAKLLPFLESSNDTVRAEAARGTLIIAPERASAVLEQIVETKDSHEILRAAETLRRWRDGKTIVYVGE